MRKWKYISLSVAMLQMLNAASLYQRTQPQKPKEKEEITRYTKTGFMLGLENGYMLNTYSNESAIMIALGLNVGYNIYFTTQFGLRLVGNYSYMFNIGQIPVVLDYDGAQRFGFGLDFLYDFFNNKDLGLSLGIFAGINGGYQIQNNINGFFSSANVGFDIIFDSHNRLDIAYRYHFLTPSMVRGNIGVASSPFGLYLGYSYIF